MNFDNLNNKIALPSYERHTLKTKIIHFGLGAFHRGHQAFIHHQLLEYNVQNKTSQNNDWGICTVNLMSGLPLVEAMHQQNGLYSVLEKSDKHTTATIVGAIIECLQLGKDGLDALINKLCESQVEIITFTITEKGYCALPGGKGIDISHPLIEHDLNHLDAPKSIPGILYKALKLRYLQKGKGITLLSCDNMPENGKALKRCILGFVERVDPDFIPWIEANIAFPSSMVDRIVPAITAETLSHIASHLNTQDPCGIVTEPFIQWVIEDQFSGNRPAWENVPGVQVVKDVIPFEEMKLRMLNGSHSFLAYLGYLAGFEHISDCMNHPAYKKACAHLMTQEQAITLTTQDTDLNQYASLLMQRFENSSLKHRTWQIAMDGTQKIPQRFLASIVWHIEHQHDYVLLALGVAAWMRYVGGFDDQNMPIDVKDPMSETLKSICQQNPENVARVKALLSLSAVFGTDLPKNAEFVNKVTLAYQNLSQQGALNTLIHYTEKL